MTPADLSRTVLRAVRRAVDDGEFGVVAAGDVERAVARVVVERPRPGGHGDYATNAALQIARPTGRPPRQIAEVLSRRLAGSPGIAAVEISGPGFLNLTLVAADPGRELVGDILRQGSGYGHGDALRGHRLDLRVAPELRAEVVADALTRIARSQGAEVRDIKAPVPADGGDHSGTGAPATVRPVTVQPGAIQPGAIQPVTDRPATIRPATIRPATIRPGAIQPGAPQPATIQPVSVRPVPVTDPDRLYARLGRDAARWALLHPAAHDHPRTATAEDRAVLLAQRETNPLFRVRYAHARTRALTRNAADLGYAGEPGPTPGHDRLVAALGEHPRLLLSAATHHAPDRLARHLVGVADALLPALGDVLPLGGEKPSAAHRARLALAEAAGTVLAGGLTLLGIDAPVHV
ncbi:ArgS-related anticodon-binding protein NrtL [Streptomyces sp. NPDC088785]|uniref:ArgS-related anticodon-binding protein NrtL n=1 Tax=Streptomyces sp. NPDC088785 TaxID=3365897 RepID=UPI00382C8512